MYCKAFIIFATLSMLSLPAPLAHALDCPCTWEEMLCSSDAIAEVEVSLATETTKDRMEVRRIIWTGTKYRIPPTMSGSSYMPLVTPSKANLQRHVAAYERKRVDGNSVPEDVRRYRRALEKGSYRLIAFLRRAPRGPWYGGGVALLDGVEWLDHPSHDTWWAKLQPLLAERMRLAPQNRKPDYCANTDRDKTAFPRYLQ